MAIQIHKAENRGMTKSEWLTSYHSFSFASYHDDDNIHFGPLRVINDDTVAPGKGFHLHPHQNMEIITIPLSGELQHKDTLHNTQTIKPGQIQIMSAGTGVLHSEFNASKEDEVTFLQIWVIPAIPNGEPEYKMVELENSLDQKETVLISPDAQNGAVSIKQTAWFTMGNYNAGERFTYSMKGKGTGLYMFIIEGEVEVFKNHMKKRDALSLTEMQMLKGKVKKDAQILFIEVIL